MTTSEAAAYLGIDPATLRRWVMKGWLVPVLPRSKPLRFRGLDVERARAKRMSPADHERLDRLAAAWRILDVG